MQGQIWRQLAGESGQAEVLDDQGINAGGGGLQHQIASGLQLPGE